jgi:hypothetical protein
VTENYPNSVRFPDSEKKKAERIAALLNLDGWCQAFDLGVKLALKFAEAYIKGDTEIVYCTPKVSALIENNPKFIKALCEEGVVEWLTPFVLTKSSQAPSGDELAP